MKLIVGLGNPGKKYENTRHNLGFMVADGISNYFHSEWTPECNYLLSVFQKGSLMAKPETFMNDSGKAIKILVREYKIDIDDLLVVHDDLDLVFGKFKLQFGKGPHQHNGVLSVEKELGTKEFWRLRMGVESRIKNQELGIRGEDYVLQDFSPAERKVIDELIDKKIVPEIKNWLLKK